MSMYLPRRRLGYGYSMSKSELFNNALGAAIKASVRQDVPVLIMEEQAMNDPGMFVENESEVRLSHERRRIFARVLGWKIEWLS
jgi:hypothetical protein